jgi:hypothetical protein
LGNGAEKIHCAIEMQKKLGVLVVVATAHADFLAHFLIAHAFLQPYGFNFSLGHWEYFPN